MVRSLISYLDRQSKPFILSLAFLLTMLIGYADYLTGADISLSIFYLLPIGMAAWLAGRWAGWVFSGLGAATWLIANAIPADARLSLRLMLWNAAVRLGFFCITAVLLVELRQTLDREIKLAKLDFLTGISNRRGFYELAEMERLRCLRYKRPLTLAYLDIDDFKDINDHYGHELGDELLVKVAQQVGANIRKTDAIARLGGDEFVLLLPETDTESAKIIMDKLHRLLRRNIESATGAVTFSIGVFTFAEVPEAVDQMLNQADRLMLSVKKRGKNNIAYATTAPATVGTEQPR